MVVMEVVLQNAQMDVQNHVLRVAWNIVKEHAKAIVREGAFKPVQGVVAVLVLELVLVLQLQKTKRIQ